MAEWEKAATKFREIGVWILRQDSPVLLYNYDADGCSAGAIMASWMTRASKKFSSRAVKQLYKDTIAEIKAMGNAFIFVDFGSGQLDELSNVFGDTFCVLDHHQPVEIDYPLHWNPFHFGYHGGKEVSAAGISYLLAREMNEANADLAAIAVVGACGDMQDETGKLEGLNAQIVCDGVKAKVLSVKTDLRLFGRISRPLAQYLMFSTAPVLPDLTANEDNCRRFLAELGIDEKKGESWRSYEDLRPHEKTVLSSALINRLHRYRVPEWKIQEMVGEVYTLEKEEKKSPLRDSKEFATLLNACVIPGTNVYLNGIPTPVEKIETAPVFSVQNETIVRDRVVQVHKVPLSGDVKLFAIRTQTGRELTVTQNHEILSLENETKKWIPTEKLGLGQWVAISKQLPDYGKQIKIQDFFDGEKLKLNKGWFRLPQTISWVKVPEFDHDLGFITGYIAGDGHLSRNRVDIAFSRKKRDVHSFEICKKIFSEKLGTPDPTLSEKPNCFNADWSGQSLSFFFHKLGIPQGKKSSTVAFQPLLLEAERPFIRGLLKGLFSSDGGIYSNGIEFSSHSKPLIDQMVFLLQRFGLIAHVSSRPCSDCNGKKYRLIICGGKNTKKFATDIGFAYEETNQELVRRARRMNPKNSREGYLPLGKNLLELAGMLGVANQWSAHFTYYRKGVQPSIDNLHKYAESYQRQIEKVQNAIENRDIVGTVKALKTSQSKFAKECGISREWLTRIVHGKNPQKNAKKKLELGFARYSSAMKNAQRKVTELLALVHSDLHWDKIKEIKEVVENRPSHVYDLTVEKNHNYIANGIVVHNCGRHGQAEIGMNVAMGDRFENYEKALSLLVQHRRELREGIMLMHEKGLEEKEMFFFFDSEGKISDSIIGIVAGMLYGSGSIGENKPIIALARYEDGVAKASGRATRELVRNGLNIGGAFRRVCGELGHGAEGGGHAIAAGCKFNVDQLDEFLEKLNGVFKEQLRGGPHEK